jgi:hypothetical protein
MMPLCRFCGERHPLLQCPDFDEVEKKNVAKAETKTETKAVAIEEAWRPNRIPARVIPPPLELAPPIDHAPKPMSKGEPAGGAGGRDLLVELPRRTGKGRCLEKDRPFCLHATQPWKAAGMSRATWYRRQKSSPQLSTPQNSTS